MDSINGFKWENGKRVPVKILAVGFDNEGEGQAIFVDGNSIELRCERLYCNSQRRWQFVTGLVENK